jgi:hypothetical protein
LEYRPKTDSVTHKLNWGSFYNGIGDSRRAVDYLESAYKERPDAPIGRRKSSATLVSPAMKAALTSWREHRASSRNELATFNNAFSFLS